LQIEQTNHLPAKRPRWAKNKRETQPKTMFTPYDSSQRLLVFLATFDLREKQAILYGKSAYKTKKRKPKRSIFT